MKWRMLLAVLLAMFVAACGSGGVSEAATSGGPSGGDTGGGGTTGDNTSGDTGGGPSTGTPSTAETGTIVLTLTTDYDGEWTTQPILDGLGSTSLANSVTRPNRNTRVYTWLNVIPGERNISGGIVFEKVVNGNLLVAEDQYSVDVTVVVGQTSEVTHVTNPTILPVGW